MRNTFLLILAFTLFAGRAAAQCNVKITDPNPVCFPATVDLTADAVTAGSASGLIFTYWTDAGASNKYLTPGTATAGTYYIKGDNGAGCTQVKPVVATVTTPPTATISYAGTPFCRSLTTAQPVTLSGTGAYTGGSYSSSGGLSINPSTGSITPSTSTVGNYTVTYTIPASGGCPTVPVTTSVTILAVPAAPGIGTPVQPTCTISTGSVELSGLPSPSWTITSNPAGITLTGNTPTIIINALLAGTTYTFRVTNSDGCTSPSSGNVTIIVQPVPPGAPVIGQVTPPTCSVATGSVALSGLPAGNWTVRRTPGGVDTPGSTTSATIAGIPSGTYGFSVTTNPAGCVSPPSNDVTIPVSPLNLSAPIVGQIDPPTCTVSTGSVTLSGLPSPGSWTLTRSPDGAQYVNNGTSYRITGLPDGVIYTFTVSNSTGCTSAASTNVDIINQPGFPTAPKVGKITPPTCTLASGSVLLTDLPATGTWTVTRLPGSDTTKGTGISKTIPDLLAGRTYNFTVTNQSGCASGPSANVIIPAQPVTPSAPVVVSIQQPTYTVPTGSVVLSGLPSGNWILTRLPDQVTTPGSTTGKTVSSLTGGSYFFTVKNSVGCVSDSTVEVRISTPGPPDLIITDPPTVCSPATVNLKDPLIIEGSTTGLTYTYWIDTLATNEYLTPTTAVAGKYYIKGTTVSGYFSIGPVIVTIDQMAIANAGPDQIIANAFTATLDAELGDNEIGVWKVDSGTGLVSDTLDPKSDISNLSEGNNILLWKVINGVCPADTDKVILTVGDIIVPTLITPNGDSQNEYFVILGLETLGKTELVIFDRRGALVFKNTDYDNKWNGVDYNENPLPDDTYFFILNSAKGRVVKSYIVIRR